MKILLQFKDGIVNVTPNEVLLLKSNLFDKMYDDGFNNNELLDLKKYNVKDYNDLINIIKNNDCDNSANTDNILELIDVLLLEENIYNSITDNILKIKKYSYGTKLALFNNILRDETIINSFNLYSSICDHGQLNDDNSTDYYLLHSLNEINIIKKVIEKQLYQVKDIYCEINGDDPNNYNNFDDLIEYLWINRLDSDSYDIARTKFPHIFKYFNMDNLLKLRVKISYHNKIFSIILYDRKNILCSIRITEVGIENLID